MSDNCAVHCFPQQLSPSCCCKSSRNQGGPGVSMDGTDTEEKIEQGSAGAFRVVVIVWFCKRIFSCFAICICNAYIYATPMQMIVSRSKATWWRVVHIGRELCFEAQTGMHLSIRAPAKPSVCFGWWNCFEHLTKELVTNYPFNLFILGLKAHFNLTKYRYFGKSS